MNNYVLNYLVFRARLSLTLSRYISHDVGRIETGERRQQRSKERKRGRECCTERRLMRTWVGTHAVFSALCDFTCVWSLSKLELNWRNLNKESLCVRKIDASSSDASEIDQSFSSLNQSPVSSFKILIILFGSIFPTTISVRFWIELISTWNNEW